jgi:hypothetical protein
MRILSIGLDVPLDTRENIYNKGFSYQEMSACLEACQELGIIILATVVGDPFLTKEQFERQLAFLYGLPIADVDVRLAIALRNTPYYASVKDLLIYCPDENGAYFDRQNYRYQTILVPDKIEPTETYEAVSHFKREFFLHEQHLRYVNNMIERHPDTIHFFRRQYRKIKDQQEIAHDARLEALSWL